MTAEPRREAFAAPMASEETPVVSFTALRQIDHLLKAAGSVSQDASQAWADIWGQCKELATGDGMVVAEAQESFVPPCGWPEFLERLWLLKHYLDSLQRICERKH